MLKFGDELSAQIYRVNKLFRLKIQETIRPYDLTTDQWVLLGKVYSDSGNLNQKELAAVCFKERAAVTRTLDIMEKKGLLERRDSEEDRRIYKLFITDYGKEIYEKTHQQVKKMEGQIDGTLSEEEFEQAIALMSKLEKSLRGE